MDLLDQSVLPQSSSHLVLLKYLIGIVYIMFLPYVSILFGALCYSLYFNRKSKKSGNQIYRNFSKELIDYVTFSRGVAFVFGVLPLVVFILGYAQIFHSADSSVPPLLLITLALLTVSILLIYSYKYAFHFKDIFDYASENKTQENSNNNFSTEIDEYNKQAKVIYTKSGRYALILLVVATYIFVGTMQLAGDPESWADGSLFKIFSPIVFVCYLQFFIASFAITSVLIIFRFFRSNTQQNFNNEQVNLKNFIFRVGTITTIILPTLIIITTMTRPVLSLSYNYFIIILASLFLLIVICSMLYLMKKESNYKFSPILLALFILLFTLLSLQDQLAINNSSKKNSAILAAGYEAYELNLKEEMGIDTKPINGADIYNGRCIACHRFDVKVVGPPYNQTLPKYEGKKAELVSFIMNPVKKNPDYPAMPNQGLKPKEAEAVADYLLNTYKKQ